MSLHRFSEIADRLTPREAPTVTALSRGFLALPLPAVVGAERVPSCAEELYRFAFAQAQAEQQPRHTGPNLFASWN